MNALETYLIPYLISNFIAVVLLVSAFRLPVITRWIFVIIFFAAGLFNTYTAAVNPLAYLVYSESAMPFYQDFINGVFSQYIQLFVLHIAVGQLLVALFLALQGLWFRLGVLGSIIFLLAIIPLGVGSAFPCSLILAAAIYIVYQKHKNKL